MEGVEATKAPSQAPVPAPPRRGLRAATLFGLLALAADAVLCCYFAALWVLSATCAFMIAARRAFGNDSRAVAISLVLLAVALAAVLLFRIAFLLTRRAEAPEIGLVPWSGAQRRRSRASLCGDNVIGPAIMVGFVGTLMHALAPTESWLGRVGFMAIEFGCFLYSVTSCFICFPELLIQMRATYAKLKRGMGGLF